MLLDKIIIMLKKKNGIRTRIIAVNILTSIIPLVVLGLLTSNVFYENTKKRTLDSINVLFRQMNGKIEESFRSIDLLSRSAFYSENFKSVMSQDIVYLEKYAKIRGILDSFVEMNESIKAIAFIDNKGMLFRSSSDAIGDEIINYINRMDKERLKEGSIIFVDPYRNIKNNTYIAVRSIKGDRGSEYLQEVGIAILLLDKRKLSWIVNENNVHSESKVYMFDADKNLIASTVAQNADEAAHLLSGENPVTEQVVSFRGLRYIAKTSSLKYSGWKLAALIPENELYADGVILKKFIIVSISVIIFIVLLFTILISAAITSPLKKLIGAFERVADGDFKFNISFKDENEITFIAQHFNKMVQEIKKLTRKMLKTQQQLYEAELEKKHMELISLQTQINSHFLYNTIHCLRGMVLTQSTRQMTLMINNIVQFLRYASSVKEFVTLQEELGHLENYMEIQQQRFNHRIKYSVDVKVELKNCVVLRLLFQPMVENSVVHGLERKIGGGTIKIQIQKKDEELFIKIIDNGVGMAADKVLLLNERLHNIGGLTEEQTGERSSIGLSNVQRRLNLYYDKRYNITVKSWEGRGTVINLKLPYTNR